MNIVSHRFWCERVKKCLTGLYSDAFRPTNRLNSVNRSTTSDIDLDLAGIVLTDGLEQTQEKLSGIMMILRN
jgi:hypothetical protein